MIKIPAAGGYDQLVYTDLPECGYTEGANIKLDGKCILEYSLYIKKLLEEAFKGYL